MKCKLLTLALLIAASCGVAVVLCLVDFSGGESASSDEPALKEWVNNSLDVDVPPGYVPRYQWAGDAERRQLETAWASAATNLLNGNVRGVEECVAAVSERMKSIAPEQFHGIVRPCYDIVKGNFMGGILSRSYSAPDEFRTHVMANIHGMNVLGDIEFSASLVPAYSAYLEADALSMLRKCVKKFTDEGKDDFATVAKELEGMVVDQIESENGLTRRYLRSDLKMQMLLFKRGYSTRENVMRGVRADAGTMRRVAGYTPKWLDEELPLPAKSGEAEGL